MGKEKEREYLFDNYRFFLIFLVVVGHFVEPCFKNSLIISAMRGFIFSFHMPAFIFISGYFSKSVESLRKLIQKLLIPYFVYEILYYLLYTYVIHKETKLYLAYPKFTLWYLAALFVWRFLTPWIRKIPYYLPLSFLAGLLIGFSELDNFLTIPRIVYFYPFFLAGTCFTTEYVTQIRHRFRRASCIAVGGLSLGTLLALLCIYTSTIRICHGRYSYASMGLNATEGILTRILCYLVSFGFLFFFMILLPKTQTAFSYIGQRTLPVYIFHGLLFQTMNKMTPILSTVRTFPQILGLLLFCLFLVWFFSRKPFLVITGKIASVPLGPFRLSSLPL